MFLPLLPTCRLFNKVEPAAEVYLKRMDKNRKENERHQNVWIILYRFRLTSNNVNYVIIIYFTYLQCVSKLEQVNTFIEVACTK